MHDLHVLTLVWLLKLLVLKRPTFGGAKAFADYYRALRNYLERKHPHELDCLQPLLADLGLWHELAESHLRSALTRMYRCANMPSFRLAFLPAFRRIRFLLFTLSSQL
jgi:hypothetical protein